MESGINLYNLYNNSINAAVYYAVIDRHLHAWNRSATKPSPHVRSTDADPLDDPHTVGSTECALMQREG